MQSLPAVFQNRSNAEDVADDVARAYGTTIEDRARILDSLCRMAAEITAQHRNPRRVLDWREPISEEAEALPARLRARG